MHLRQEDRLTQQRWILLRQLALQVGQLSGCFAHDEAQEVARERQPQSDAVDEGEPTHATDRLVTTERARVDLRHDERAIVARHAHALRQSLGA